MSYEFRCRVIIWEKLRLGTKSGRCFGETAASVVLLFLVSSLIAFSRSRSDVNLPPPLPLIYFNIVSFGMTECLRKIETLGFLKPLSLLKDITLPRIIIQTFKKWKLLFSLKTTSF